MTDEIAVETSDHARLKLKLSYVPNLFGHCQSVGIDAILFLHKIVKVQLAL